MENNETHIIQRILRGETALYEYFLNQHGQQVFSLIARIICNQEDAEELTQDVFSESVPAPLLFQSRKFVLNMDLFHCL